jgi:thymidylate synthase (FAD)
LSSPIFLVHPTYVLPPHDGDEENIIAQAGKVCYDSYGPDGRSVEQHVRSLVESGHHSVLEHAHVGVFIEGLSRGCSHEIVRHRMFNYSQRSTRYTDEGDAAIVLDPYFADIYRRSEMAHHDDRAVGRERIEADCAATGVSTAEYNLVAQFLEDCEVLLDRYAELVQELEELNPEQLRGRDLRKWCRGKARQLLPHALETRLVMTGNLRAWRHFFLMRTSRHAEAEIRRLAHELFAVIQPQAPVVFEDLAMDDVAGFIELRPMHKEAA